MYKKFYYNTLIIKSEENINYLDLNDLMFKIIIRVSKIIKPLFNDKCYLFFIEEINKNEY
jgi:hypothetical protein